MAMQSIYQYGMTLLNQRVSNKRSLKHIGKSDKIEKQSK